MNETITFDADEQDEPTCPCGYELDTDFSTMGTPFDAVEFCWNCRFYWGRKAR